MDDEEPRPRDARRSTLCRNVVEQQPIGGALTLAFGGDGEQARGLLDDEQILVLVHEPQRRGKRRRGGAEADPRPGRDLCRAAAHDDTVDAHTARREPAAHGRARGVRKERLQAIEQRAQRGGRGPSTSVTGVARYVRAARWTSAAVTACTAAR